MFEKTKKFCDSFLDMGLPGFDLAVYKGGECILRYMNGYSDLENKIKMQGDERYNIYSCSKAITCVAALQLFEKGMFSLEDKLSDYMPEFAQMTVKCEGGVRKAEKPILIMHLFEMTAGFDYDARTPEIIKCLKETNGRAPTVEVIKALAKSPLSFEPGEKWQYSLCHDVLAALVEVISGEKFEDYVKKNIFDAVGMKNSTFMLPDEELDTLAEQYYFRGGAPDNIGKRIDYYKVGSEYASGGAGCISTVNDYIKFLEGIRTYKLLSPETVKLMSTNRLNKQQIKTYTQPMYGYGLGFRCSIGIDKFGDFGWGGAASAYFTIDPENEISIYFGAHLLASPMQTLRRQIYRFVRAELLDESEFDAIFKELEKSHNYKYDLTY